VLTSSCITITGNAPNGDYNDDHWTDINKIGFYPKSKWLAEKALWELHKKQEGEHKTEMVVIMPSLIFGPTIVDNTGALSYSEGVTASFLKGSFPGIPSPDI
jgi:nucleoside-diphosphate-sugar epimerase